MAVATKIGKFPSVIGRPIKVATFGDSTATIQWAGNRYDLRNPPAFVTGMTNDQKVNARTALGLYMPCLYVANGGISGQRTSDMIARNIVASSVTRASVADILSCEPDIVVMCAISINDIIGLLTTTYDQSVVDGIISRHMQIVNSFLDSGISVYDVGCYGYSEAVSTAITETRRQAVNYINDYMKGVGLYGYNFVDMSGITHDNAVFKAGMSTDGVHLSAYGQTVASKKVAEKIQTFVCSGRLKNNYNYLYSFGNTSAGNIPSGFTLSTAAQVLSKTTTQTGIEIELNVTAVNSTLALAFDLATLTAWTPGDTMYVSARVVSEAPTPIGIAQSHTFAKSDDSTAKITYGLQENSFIGTINPFCCFKTPLSSVSVYHYFQLILLPVGTYKVKFERISAGIV